MARKLLAEILASDMVNNFFLNCGSIAILKAISGVLIQIRLRLSGKGLRYCTVGTQVNVL